MTRGAGHVHADIILRLRPHELPELGPPRAASYLDIPPSDINAQSLFATATPSAHGSVSYIDTQPLFFRMLVPPILTEHPSPGRITRYPDSPQLRALVEAETKTLLERFSADASISLHDPVQAPRLPLLEETEKSVSSTHFADCDLLAVQHLYASTVSLFDALVRHGIDPAGATLIGKSYSTCYGAAQALRARGAHVPSASLEPRAIERHDEHLEATVCAALEAYRERVKRGDAKPRLLVLEDGGHVTRLLHEKFPDLVERVTVVEQTTRGVRELERLEESGRLACRAVTVGDSAVKVELESPLIAQSGFHEVLRKVLHLRTCGLPVGNELSVNGCGNVGRAVAEAFAARGFRVRIYDPALSPGDPLFRVPGISLVEDRRAFLEGASVLVSATGQAPIRLADYRHLPDRALLFNVASSNDELDAAAAIQAARLEQPAREWWDPVASARDRTAYLEGLPDLLADREYVLPSTGWLWGEFGDSVIPLGHIARRAQRDRILHFADKDLFLAKSGFVVNHTDEEDPIPPELIDLTRSALFAGCVEAVELADTPGRSTLSESRQAPLRAAFEPRMRAAPPGTLLWEPDWLESGPHLTRFEAPPTLAGFPPEVREVIEGIVFPSPAHVLHHGASGPGPQQA